jgi:predicted nucleic acid-binding protein
MTLLDSSILIDFLRQKDKKGTLFFRLISDHESCAISIITHAELYAGKSVWEQKRAKDELESMISGLEILPITQEISQNAGKLRAKYGIHLLDALIAQTALSHEIPLVTLNTKHFSNIPRLKLTSA